jgi:hypothetical protein
MSHYFDGTRRFQIVYPYTSDKIHVEKNISHGAYKCYNEIKEKNIKTYLFIVHDIDAGTLYYFNIPKHKNENQTIEQQPHSIQPYDPCAHGLVSRGYDPCAHSLVSRGYDPCAHSLVSRGYDPCAHSLVSRGYDNLTNIPNDNQPIGQIDRPIDPDHRMERVDHHIPVTTNAIPSEPIDINKFLANDQMEQHNLIIAKLENIEQQLVQLSKNTERPKPDDSCVIM